MAADKRMNGLSQLSPSELAQLARVQTIVKRHLEPTLLAIHLYGSALSGGLKPYSDLDLLVTVSTPLGEERRRTFAHALLNVSAPPIVSATAGGYGLSGKSGAPDQAPNGREGDALRSVEVTVVLHQDVVPWRYPPRREFQFGEWLRSDIEKGHIEPPTCDIDLAVLFCQARQHSVALIGPPAGELFEPVPQSDFFTALGDTLKLWNEPSDWAGDERNVVLTLARIWYSAETGQIVAKDAAAQWASRRLPEAFRQIVLEARAAYLGRVPDRLTASAEQLASFVHYVKDQANQRLSR